MITSDNRLQRRTPLVILAQKYCYDCSRAFFTIAWWLKSLPRSWETGPCSFLLAVSLAWLVWHFSLCDGTTSTGKVATTFPEAPGSTRVLSRSELQGFHPVWFQKPDSPSSLFLAGCSCQYAIIQRGQHTRNRHAIFEVWISLCLNVWTLCF